VFDNAVDPQWRADLFHLIEQTPNLDWLLLTKRIGNAEKMIREARLSLVGSTRLVVPDVLPNVWLGATIVNQEEADRDIEKLLMTPARRRFLSIEPMLGPVDLQAWFDPTGMCCGQEMTSCEDCPASAEWIHGPTTEYAEDGSGYSSPTIDWVIVGGESGPGARPMHPDWARALRDQCTQYGVAFLFKQWGEWIAEGVEMPAPLKRMPDPYQRRWVADDAEDDRYTRTAAAVHRVGKKASGRLLDGRTHDDFPQA
jgi:protein gp37